MVSSWELTGHYINRGGTVIKYLCDECGHHNEVKYCVDKKVTGIHVTYLKCEICKVKFTCYVTSNKVRKLIKDNKKLRERKDLSSNEAKQVVKNDEEIESKMKLLKEKYG